MAAAVADTGDPPLARGAGPAEVAHARRRCVAAGAGARRLACASAGAHQPAHSDAGRRGGAGRRRRAGAPGEVGLADALAVGAGAVPGAVLGAGGLIAGVGGPLRIADARPVQAAGAVSGAAVGANGEGAVLPGEPRGAQAAARAPVAFAVARAHVQARAAVLFAWWLGGVAVTFQTNANSVVAFTHSGAVERAGAALTSAANPQVIAHANPSSGVTLAVRAAVVRTRTNRAVRPRPSHVTLTSPTKGTNSVSPTATDMRAVKGNRTI